MLDETTTIYISAHYCKSHTHPRTSHPIPSTTSHHLISHSHNPTYQTKSRISNTLKPQSPTPTCISLVSHISIYLYAPPRPRPHNHTTPHHTTTSHHRTATPHLILITPIRLAPSQTQLRRATHHRRGASSGELCCWGVGACSSSSSGRGVGARRSAYVGDGRVVRVCHVVVVYRLLLLLLRSCCVAGCLGLGLGMGCWIRFGSSGETGTCSRGLTCGVFLVLVVSGWLGRWIGTEGEGMGAWLYVVGCGICLFIYIFFKRREGWAVLVWCAGVFFSPAFLCGGLFDGGEEGVEKERGRKRESKKKNRKNAERQNCTTEQENKALVGSQKREVQES